MTGYTPDDILNDAIVREARWGGRQIPYEAGGVPRPCGEVEIPMSDIVDGHRDIIDQQRKQIDQLRNDLAVANRRITQLQTFCFCQNCSGYVFGHTTCDRCGTEATRSTVQVEIHKLIVLLAGKEQLRQEIATLTEQFAAANARYEKLDTTLNAYMQQAENWEVLARDWKEMYYGLKKHICSAVDDAIKRVISLDCAKEEALAFQPAPASDTAEEKQVQP